MLPSANDIALRANVWYTESEVREMKKEDKLSDLSLQLSVDVIPLCKKLRAQGEDVIAKQLYRSATSICANISESKYGQSRADFISKLEIALKETNETDRWLTILHQSELIDEVLFNKLHRPCGTIRFLLIKSVTTAKKNANK